MSLNQAEKKKLNFMVGALVNIYAHLFGATAAEQLANKFELPSYEEAEEGGDESDED